MKDQKTRILRASEIGQYAYCARAWWLGSVMGIPSHNTSALARGDAHHHTHGRQVQSASWLRWLALALLLLAMVVFVVGLMTT